MSVTEVIKQNAIDRIRLAMQVDLQKVFKDVVDAQLKDVESRLQVRLIEGDVKDHFKIEFYFDSGKSPAKD